MGNEHRLLRGTQMKIDKVIQDTGCRMQVEDFACIVHHASGRKSNNGQVSLEVTVAFICIMLLLFASVRIFVWMNQRMVQRQKDYENSRVAAGSVRTGTKGVWEGYINEDGEYRQRLVIRDDQGVYIDYSNVTKYPKLDILGENR